MRISEQVLKFDFVILTLVLQTLWEGLSDPIFDASEMIAVYKHNLTACLAVECLNTAGFEMREHVSAVRSDTVFSITAS